MLIEQCFAFKYRADLKRFFGGLREARLPVSINETAYRGVATTGLVGQNKRQAAIWKAILTLVHPRPVYRSWLNVHIVLFVRFVRIERRIRWLLHFSWTFLRGY